MSRTRRFGGMSVSFMASEQSITTVTHLWPSNLLKEAFGFAIGVCDAIIVALSKLVDVVGRLAEEK